jgi:hypothetical protein
MGGSSGMRYNLLEQSQKQVQRYSSLSSEDKAQVELFRGNEGYNLTDALARLDSEKLQRDEERNKKNLEDTEQAKMQRLDMLRGSSVGQRRGTQTILGGFSTPKSGKRLLGY